MLVLSIDWEQRVAIVKDTGAPLPTPPKLVFEIKIGQLIFKGVNLMFLLRDDQTAHINIQAVDAKGFDAQLQTITYSSSDESVATVSNAVITAVKPGTATINVVADADLGDGVTQIAGTLDIQVVAGQAIALAVTAELITAAVSNPSPVATPAPVAVDPAPTNVAPV